MNAMPNQRGPLNILLVEDNEDDVFLTREGMREAGIPANLHRVANGSECMSYLRRQGAYAEEHRPDLVLLDLNMPVMDGREVLAEVRRDEALRLIPVVMLTTSSAHEDIESAYRLFAHAYVIKPTSFDEFIGALRSIGAFWLRVSALPNRQDDDAFVRRPG
jgi:two-component system response regulator